MKETSLFSKKGEKSTMKSKIAKALVTLMLVSIMSPVLALAGAWFKDVHFYTDGSVTGSVYTLNHAGETVSVNVYDKDGNFIKTVTTSVYSIGADGYYYYNFPNNTVVGATYDPITLNAFGTVTKTVYQEALPSSSPPPIIGGGGGGGGGGTGTIISSGVVSAGQLTAALANNMVVTIKISGDTATLPASALAAARAGSVVVIENETGSYKLPLDLFDFEALADELGVALADLKLVITIAALSGDAATEVSEAAGGADLAAVEFSVEAVAGNESVAITDFGDTYVERTINVNADASATGVLYDPETGTFSFIPSTFANGVATLKSTTNSIYVVLELDNSFADVNGHWAQSYVETIANKLIVEGYEDGSFGPDRNITRAEFATLIVRALGLNGKAAPDSQFLDVSTSDWFEGAVALAYDAGIVNGYEDGTFQANKVITREELAAMVVRASAYAGAELSASVDVLDAFSDADSIVWAHEEIAAAVEAGIVTGYEDDTFRATKTATRAEAVTMINRFLVNAGFINE